MVLRAVRSLVGLALLMVLPWAGPGDTATPPPAAGGVVTAPRADDALADYRELPLSFVPNVGQADAHVGFVAQSGGATFAFTPTEASLALTPQGDVPARRLELALRFVGGDPHAAVAAEDRAPGVVNYLLGRNPAGWRTGVPTYSQLRYRRLWPGVDLTFRGADGSLKYQFEVAPGADPAAARLAYSGARRVRVMADGSLAIDSPAGTLTDTAPVSYQDVHGRRTPVASRFVVDPANPTEFRVAVGSYDRSQPLVIDPGLVYSTFVGGAVPGGVVDQGFGIAVDAGGSAYITGRADSIDFPTTPGAFAPTHAGANDAFVTKLDPSGSALVYSTFLGGAEFEQGLAIRVDAAGRAYVTGQTQSADFPTTPGAHDPTFNGGTDAFATALDPTGSRLEYSTYLGTPSFDAGQGLAVDSLGHAVVVGFTDSPSFPTTPGAYDTGFNGGVDTFVTKLDATGTTLLYSTYLGGAGTDLGHGAAVDPVGNAYVTGRTTSADFPTSPGAYDVSYNGGSDAFVTKLDVSGSAVGYSTYLGGGMFDEATAIALDATGAAYVTGGTTAPDYPVTPGAYDTMTNGRFDVFVTKLNPSGTSLVYSTFVGGSLFEIALAVAVDATGRAYVTGDTESTDFPTTPTAVYRSFNGGAGDAFLAVLGSTGATLDHATYLGGSEFDQGRGVALDPQRNVYVTGFTSSTDYPTTPGAYDTTLGRIDAFVTKLDVAPTPTGAARVTLSPPAGTNPVGSAHTITATATGLLGGPVANLRILFMVTGSVSTSGTCTTSPAGECEFTYQGPELPGADAITGCADNDGDAGAGPAEPCGTATKAWVLPVGVTCDATVTGGGFIFADNGDRASFGGNARAIAGGGVQGHQTYQDHGPARHARVQSVELLALTCRADRTGATVFGRATVDGVAESLFRIDLRDLGEPGTGHDRYRILLSNGYDSGDHVLEGGNIQIR